MPDEKTLWNKLTDWNRSPVYRKYSHWRVHTAIKSIENSQYFSRVISDGIHPDSLEDFDSIDRFFAKLIDHASYWSARMRFKSNTISDKIQWLADAAKKGINIQPAIPLLARFLRFEDLSYRHDEIITALAYASKNGTDISSILQETTDRFLYPAHISSDRAEDISFRALIDLSTFAELGIDVSEIVSATLPILSYKHKYLEDMDFAKKSVVDKIPEDSRDIFYYSTRKTKYRCLEFLAMAAEAGYDIHDVLGPIINILYSTDAAVYAKEDGVHAIAHAVEHGYRFPATDISTTVINALFPIFFNTIDDNVRASVISILTSMLPDYTPRITLIEKLLSDIGFHKDVARARAGAIGPLKQEVIDHLLGIFKALGRHGCYPPGTTQSILNGRALYGLNSDRLTSALLNCLLVDSKHTTGILCEAIGCGLEIDLSTIKTKLETLVDAQPSQSRRAHAKKTATAVMLELSAAFRGRTPGLRTGILSSDRPKPPKGTQKKRTFRIKRATL